MELNLPGTNQQEISRRGSLAKLLKRIGGFQQEKHFCTSQPKNLQSQETPDEKSIGKDQLREKAYKRRNWEGWKFILKEPSLRRACLYPLSNTIKVIHCDKVSIKTSGAAHWVNINFMIEVMGDWKEGEKSQARLPQRKIHITLFNENYLFKMLNNYENCGRMAFSNFQINATQNRENILSLT